MTEIFNEIRRGNVPESGIPTSAAAQFQVLSGELEEAMRNSYIAVSMERNPVSIVAETLNRRQLTYVMGQYSLLPAKIVGLLGNAKAVVDARGWSEVAAELQRNIDEENGSLTNGVAHYDLLERGCREEFGIDIRAAHSHDATRLFLEKMEDLTGRRPQAYVGDEVVPAFVSGTAAALEMTAGPELLIVRKLEQLLARHEGRDDITKAGTLETFMRKHIETFEPGHRERLLEACESRILTASEREAFKRGFDWVLTTMSIWWTGLRGEVERNGH